MHLFVRSSHPGVLNQRLLSDLCLSANYAREDSLIQRCCPSPPRLRPQWDHIYAAVVIVILVICVILMSQDIPGTKLVTCYAFCRYGPGPAMW